MASMFGRFAMAQRSPAVRAAERRYGARLLQRGRRAAAQAARRVRGFVYNNPNVSAFAAGSAAQGLYAARKGSKRKRQKAGIARGRKIPRKAGGGKPPTTTSARVSAKYAVADRMTKFKKAKPTTQKIPKSAIAHYKDFGEFNAERCMYINHEHWGSVDRLWFAISLGLAKKLLAFGKIYNGKSLDDPCIGPRTSVISEGEQYDNKATAALLKLAFVTETTLGDTSISVVDIAVENTGASPDKYLSMNAIAGAIKTALYDKYHGTNKTWLQQAQLFQTGYPINAQALDPVFVQNLDDAEICVYASSLIKFQNITEADHAQGAGANPFDRNAIDANPLAGRVYSAKGQHPVIDGDLARMGDRSLDSFFGNVSANTGGITLLGHANTHTANDIGRVCHLPPAKELYGNQTVSSGTISMSAGAMKFHKTTFTLKKTFKTLADVCDYGSQSTTNSFNEMFGRHTMFGFQPSHKHGEDTIKIGYNRDTTIGCHIKHKRVVYPIKTNYTLDGGVTSTSVNPTEHAGPG